jgi:hypothetical protein
MTGIAQWLQGSVTTSTVRFDTHQGKKMFLFVTMSRIDNETLLLGTNRPGREADHPYPASAEIRNTWNHTSSTHHRHVT